MSKLVFALMVVSLATALGGNEVDKKAATSEPSATPMMVSFAELKWMDRNRSMRHVGHTHRFRFVIDAEQTVAKSVARARVETLLFVGVTLGSLYRSKISGIGSYRPR